VLVCSSSFPFLLSFHCGQNVVQPVIVLLECFSQNREPLVHRFNARLRQTAGALCAVNSTNNESRIFEYLQMLGDSWLCHLERSRQLIDGGLSFGKACQNRAARRVRQRCESGIEVQDCLHKNTFI
jgi:hypothetical protein